MSSGLKNVLLEGTAWLTLVVGIFFSVFYFDEIKAFAHSVFENGSEAVAAGRQMASERVRQTRHARRDDVDPSNFGRTVHLQASKRGHFFARAWINGRSIDVMVDTGASGVALTHEDAESIGVFVGASDYTRRSRTANGTVRSAPVTLDSIRIGDIEVDDVQASVSQPGRLHITLLGMTFLRKLSQVEFKGDNLVLTQ